MAVDPEGTRRVDSVSHAGAHEPLRDSSRLELRILEAFRRIIRAIDLHSRKLAADYRITAPQLVALNVIGEGDPIATMAGCRRPRCNRSVTTGVLMGRWDRP